MDWYVLYLRPRCEKKLAAFCLKHELKYYLPLREETKIYQRRKVTVEKPLFPSYFFSSFDSDGRLSLLKTNNVLRILEPSSKRRLLRDLAQVRKALQVDPTLSACSALAEGRRVKILGGPFMGIEGTVISTQGRTKVCLNVDMIGRALAVEVDREYLEVTD
jgi:transcription antitermination factor NusG